MKQQTKYNKILSFVIRMILKDLTGEESLGRLAKTEGQRHGGGDLEASLNSRKRWLWSVEEHPGVYGRAASRACAVTGRQSLAQRPPSCGGGKDAGASRGAPQGGGLGGLGGSGML